MTRVDVVVIAQPSGYGGTERHTLELVAELQERGRSVLLAVTEPAHYRHASGWGRGGGARLELVRAPCRANASGALAFLRWTRFLCTVRGRTAVFAKSWPGDVSTAVLVALRLAFRRLVLIEHGELENLPPRPPVKFWPYPRLGLWWRIPWLKRCAASALASLVIAPSEYSRSRLIALGGYDARRTIAVRNGVDCTALARDDVAGRAFTDSCGFSEAGFSVAIVAQLCEDKGLDVALHGVAFASRMLTPDQARNFRVVVAGNGPDAASLKALSERLGLGSVVVFLGFLEDVRPLYWSSDVILMTSRRESFGLALAEGMAAGCVPIATRVGGMTEILGTPPCGWLVPPEDPQAIAAALVDALLEKDCGTLAARAYASSRRIRSNFSARDTYRRLSEILAPGA